ncbi:MAG: WbqC family protein [Herminiimonas sp.]|nr:WbqC family protein [Herminiimonas sp.]
MKLAIMQPYFLPYLGYFQLMAQADRFVLLDDVKYINRGWINRNRILIDGHPYRFTVPVAGASHHRRINELNLYDGAPWRVKLFRTIDQAYRAAPFHAEVQPLLARIINAPATNLAEFIEHSLKVLHAYLGLRCSLTSAARSHPKPIFAGQERILEMCSHEQASHYLNLPGGRALYNPADFFDRGIALQFLENKSYTYQQFNGRFIPDLSIVDVLMFNGRDNTAALLEQVKFS